MTDLSPGTLGDELYRLSERLHGLSGTGAVFSMDLWGPVPAAGLTPVEAAAGAYGDATRVLGIGRARHGAWPRTIRDHARGLAGIRSFPAADSRREAEFLIDWALLLIEEALGPVRAAAEVEHSPNGWYAAVWTDWLLLTDEWAAVLSLNGDS